MGFILPPTDKKEKLIASFRLTAIGKRAAKRSCILKQSNDGPSEEAQVVDLCITERKKEKEKERETQIKNYIYSKNIVDVFHETTCMLVSIPRVVELVRIFEHHFLRLSKFHC